MMLERKRLRVAAVILLFAVCVLQAPSLSLAWDGSGEGLEGQETTNENDRASLYITRYSGYVNADGKGKVSVWFDITGTGKMDEIGAVTVLLYERNNASSSWTLARTYGYSSNPGMLAYNKNFHGSNVPYSGVAGRQYYAEVHFWAGKNGGGDARMIITGIVTAT